MKSARSHTAPTSCRTLTLDAYQVMSFPVMNQLLCRGSSSNIKRTIQLPLLRSQKSSIASHIFFKFHEIVINKIYPHFRINTQNQNREEQNYV